MMKFFYENNQWLSSIINLWQGPKYASEFWTISKHFNRIYLFFGAK